jgi:hypothetical protein
MQHAEYKTKVIRRQIRLMQERGIFTPPGGDERAPVQRAQRPMSGKKKRVGAKR